MGNWVMLTSTASSGSTDFAQIGLVQQNGQSSQWLFYEYATSSGTLPPQVFSLAPSSARYPFAVKYDSDDGCYNVKFDNTLMHSLCGLGWTPNRGYFMAEVHGVQDYVVGTSSSPAETYNEQYTKSGTWYYYGASGNQGLSTYNNTTYGKFYSSGWDYHKVYDSRA